MRKSFVSGVTWAAIAGVALIVACNDPKSSLPAGPSAPGVASITISGPASIAPGQSAQFTVTTRLADGTDKLDSNSPNLSWRTSNSSMLQVSPSGVATAGQQRGEATLTADLTVSGGTRRSTREVVVVPEGTYRMVGTVIDAAFPTAPIVGARIELTPGPLATTTDINGAYRLYGVPAEADVLVTAPGYHPYGQSVRLTGHTALGFLLAPVRVPGPGLDFRGSYTLAIDVVGTCSGSPPLSADLQHRRYDAVLTQDGPNVEVELTEPRFRIDANGAGNRFSGRVGPAGVTFTLRRTSYYYYGYPDVVERLSNGTFLVIDGTAATTGSAAGLSGQLRGELTNYDSTFPNGTVLLGSCSSSSPLQFTLTPR